MLRASLACVLVLGVQQQILAAMTPTGSPPEDEQVCQDWGSRFFDERCCGGEAYTLGYVPALLNFYKDCNVEPEDKALSIPGSQWLFYQCLLTKSLASKQLTPESFVNMMAGSLPDSNKSKILKIMEAEGSSADSNSIAALKKLWSDYFAAETNVCNETGKEWRVNDQLIPFKSESAPLIMFLPTTHRAIHVYGRMLEEKYRNTPLNESRALFFLGLLTTSGAASESDLRSKTYDYESMLEVLLPKYISQGSREKLMKAMVNWLQVSFSDLPVSPSNEDITTAIMEDNKKDVEAMPAEERTFFSNGFILFEAMTAVSQCLRLGRF